MHVIYLFVGIIITGTLVILSPVPVLGILIFASLYLVAIWGIFQVGWLWVVGTWLSGWLLCSGFMLLQSRGSRASGNSASLVFFAIVLWPIQLALLIIGTRNNRIMAKANANSRRSLGALPRWIEGTVEFTHSIGSEDGEEMVYLEEFSELPVFMKASLFDSLAVEEDMPVALFVEERQPQGSDNQSTELWAIKGRRVDHSPDQK